MHRLNLLYGHGIANGDATLLAFSKEHRNDVFGKVIAKKLALVFFMVGYAIAFY